MPIPAAEFASYEGSTMIDLIGAVRDMALGGGEEAQLPEANGTHHAPQDDSTLEEVRQPASPAWAPACRAQTGFGHGPQKI